MATDNGLEGPGSNENQTYSQKVYDTPNPPPMASTTTRSTNLDTGTFCIYYCWQNNMRLSLRDYISHEKDEMETSAVQSQTQNREIQRRTGMELPLKKRRATSHYRNPTPRDP
jgi:hypothetical protein